MSSQLSSLLDAAKQQGLKAEDSKQFLLQLCARTECMSSDLQVLRLEVQQLHEDMSGFGAFLRSEVESSAAVRAKLDSISLVQDEAVAAKRAGIQGLEQAIQMLGLQLQGELEIQKKMLRTIIADTHKVPTLMVLPYVPTGARFQPSNVVKKARLFICSHTLQLVAWPS